MTLNRFCHICSGYFRPLERYSGWKACNCGVRRREMEMIDLEDYITASGRYPERLNSDELTKAVKDNAVVLLNKVNQLLQELKIFDVKVSSGFRPSAVNAKVKGAAKKSLHMSGRAVDIYDPKHEIIQKIMARPDLLKKYDLWLEDPAATPQWAHLDNGTRTERALRIFKP
jgi:hypothetical protein